MQIKYQLNKTLTIPSPNYVFSLYEDLSPPRCYETSTGTALNTQFDTVDEAATMCQLTRHYIPEYFDSH
jgi:hypothetical protein